jgi:hypothetical protein
LSLIIATLHGDPSNPSGFHSPETSKNAGCADFRDRSFYV